MVRKFMLFICVFMLNANAIDISSGAGIWQQSNLGNSKYKNVGEDKVINTRKNKSYFWISLNNILPLSPDVKIEYTNISYNGKASGTFKDFSLPATLTSDSNMNMDQYDMILFYNLINMNDKISIDIGIDLKLINVDYTIDPLSDNIGLLSFNGYKESILSIVPLGYTKIRFDSKNIGIETNLKYISYANNSISDLSIKVDYNFKMTSVNFGIEAGYRYQHIKLNNDITSDIRFSGPYVGLLFKI